MLLSDIACIKKQVAIPYTCMSLMLYNPIDTIISNVHYLL